MSSRSRSHSRSVDRPTSVVQSLRMPPTHIQAKSACMWTSDDLDALFVQAHELDVQEFFGCPFEDLPEPQFADQSLAEILEAGAGFSGDGPPAAHWMVRDYIKKIEKVSRHASEANVDYLAHSTLLHLGYPDIAPNTTIDLELQYPLDLKMNGVKKTARVNVAMMTRTGAFLLLYAKDRKQVSTERWNLRWPHPQVVAQALAVYNNNMDLGRIAAQREARLNRDEALHDVLRDGQFDMIIPAFTLMGTLPCFYLISITAAFASSVARGEYPPHPTQIFYCVAPVKEPFHAMMEKNQRRDILKMFEAFKRFIPTSFTQLCRFEPLFNNTIPKPLNPACNKNVWDFVREFIWESNEHCRRKGVDKYNYITSHINYFVGSSAHLDLPSQPHMPLAGYPSTLNRYKRVKHVNMEY